MSRMRTTLVAGAATLALGAGLLAGLAPVASVASSHREAPLVGADPQIDVTDLYAFRSPDRPDSITFVSSWLPFQEPAGGPNFYLWAEHTNYEIRIDNDGDAIRDLTYRWTFKTHYRDGTGAFLFNTGVVDSLSDPDLNIYQTYDLVRIRGNRDPVVLRNDAKVVPSNVGAGSMPTYNADLFDAGVTGTATKSWVGQSDDPFFLDLRVFDLLYGGDLSEAADDTLEGFNVSTFALQVPKSQLRGPNDSVIGVWTTATRRSMRVENGDGTQTFSGPFVQVSRLGMPLVNEVVVPVALKDYFNASRPADDAQYLGAVQDPILPHVVNAVYPAFFPTIPDSDPVAGGIQRADLISVFLTGLGGLNQPVDVAASEMLRLNIDTPLCTECDPLGVIAGDVQGFPNGRRLSDDVIDVALRVAMGLLLDPHDAAVDTLGDGVDSNESAFLGSFPYVAYPHAGSEADPHGSAI